MPVDKRSTQAHSGLVLLGQAIRTALDGRSQRWLADELGIDQGVVSRIISGQIKDLTLERVRQIEDVLGVGRGQLLRAGGYVGDDPMTPEEAIAADLSLPRVLRASLIAGLVSARSGDGS